MSRFLLFIIVALSISCNNSTKEKMNEDKNTSMGYAVKSNIVPDYLLDIREIYDRDHFDYEEVLDKSGVPIKLRVYNKMNEGKHRYVDFEYLYDEKNRLKNVTSIYKLKEGKTASHSDTMRYGLQYSGTIASDPNSLYIGGYSFLFNEKNKVLEFITDFKSNLQPCRLSTYDNYGRETSSVKFHPDGLFSSSVIFEKYKYNTNDLIWTTREVNQMEIKYDNEDEFLDENGVVKIDVEFLRRKVFVFPVNFDREKRIFTDTRKIEELYDDID